MYPCKCTLLAAACALAVLQRGASAQAPVLAITSASEPVFPGEVLVLHGAGFTPACSVEVNVSSSACAPTGCPTTTLTPVEGQVADWTLKVALPLSLPVSAYSVAVVCPGAPPSSPILLNAAHPWWHQGDVGNAATVGGWLRISGALLALLPPAGTVSRLQRAIREVRDGMTAPQMGGDAAWADDSALAALASQLLDLRAQLAAVTLPQVTVRLTPVGGSSGGPPVFLPADGRSSVPVSEYSAHVPLPADLRAGEYAVAVANGYGVDTDPAAPAGCGTFVASSFFESAARPGVGSILVQPPKAWPSAVFLVNATADPCILPCPTSDDGLDAALAAAAAAGGGTVLLGPGRFYLSRPVAVPPNTLLAGSGANKTSVWFAEWPTVGMAPPILFQLNDTLAAASVAAPALGSSPAGSGLASWGVVGLTLYVTGAYQNVLYTSNRTDGFLIQGCRWRVNPYTFTWGPYAGSRGRVQNATLIAYGNVIDLHGVNHVITDNDIWGIGTLINSFSDLGDPPAANSWPSWRRGHAYSYIARNVLYCGQASHFMQLWRQVIFERNVIFGATEAAGGQSFGTGPMGGVAQHVLHADNTIRFTWGGDREVMTTDDAGGAYYGPLESVNGTVLTLAGDAWPASDWEMGGWYGSQVLVLNGTGAAQTRRVVLPGVNTTASPTNRTWVLDAPFQVTPTTTGGPALPSWVEVMPFRGRAIFHRDYNVDTGPHQLYGHAVEFIVSSVKFERVRGLIGWGQWRGWVPPPPANDSAWTEVGVDGRSTAHTLRGLMGNGLQPVVRAAYRGNLVLEREHLTNYGSNQSGYKEFFAGASHVLYPAAALNANITTSPHPVHMGVTYRGEVTPGGFLLGGDDTDVLIQDADVTAADPAAGCFDVSPRSTLVLIVNSTCSLQA